MVRLHVIPFITIIMMISRMIYASNELRESKVTSVLTSHPVILVECKYGVFTIISGLVPGNSDIYKDVSYDILLNMFFINLINLGAKCSLQYSHLKLKEKRHIKIHLIEKYLNEKSVDYLYWSDIDVLHLSLDFLVEIPMSCQFSASIEDRLIPDDHFKENYGSKHKYMSGNLLMRVSKQSKAFTRKWVEMTYSIGGVLDDQWAFEKLSVTSGLVCNNPFMTYKYGSKAIHLVSEHKIKLAKGILSGKTELIKVSGPISIFKNQLISEECDKIFRKDSFDCFVLTKSTTTHKCDVYDDARIHELFNSCVSYQPFTRVIQQIDFMRYLIGYKRGGWYFDNDVVIAKDLPSPKNRSLIISIEEDLNKKVLFVICQWAFFSMKSNKYFLELMLDILSERFTYNKIFLPTSWLTGPMRFTKVIGKYADEPDILLLGTGTFTNDTLIHKYEGSWLSNESWDDLSL